MNNTKQSDARLVVIPQYNISICCLCDLNNHDEIDDGIKYLLKKEPRAIRTLSAKRQISCVSLNILHNLRK